MSLLSSNKFKFKEETDLLESIIKDVGIVGNTYSSGGQKVFIVVDSGSFGNDIERLDKSEVASPAFGASSVLDNERGKLFDIARKHNDDIRTYQKSLAEIEGNKGLNRAAKRALIKDLEKSNESTLFDTAGELCSRTIKESSVVMDKVFRLLSQLYISDRGIASKNNDLDSEIKSTARRLETDIYYDSEKKTNDKKAVVDADYGIFHYYKAFDYLALWEQDPNGSMAAYDSDHTIFGGLKPDRNALNRIVNHNVMVIKDVLASTMIRISDMFWKTDRTGQVTIYGMLKNGLPKNKLSIETVSEFDRAFSTLDEILDKIMSGEIRALSDAERDAEMLKGDDNSEPEKEGEESEEGTEEEETDDRGGDPISPDVEKAMEDPTAKRYGLELWTDDDDTSDTAESEARLIQMIMPQKSKVFRARNDQPDDWNPMTVKDYATEFVVYLKGVSITGKVEG